VGINPKHTIFILTIFLSLFCHAETYRVVLQGLPDKVDPASNNINFVNPLLLHMYQPLVHFDEEGGLSSNVLDLKKTKSLSANFDSFELCLKENTRFWNNVAVTSTHLLMALNRATHSVAVYSNITHVAESSNKCVSVSLKKRDLRFLNKLSGTVTSLFYWDSKENEFPIGIGPYKPISWSDDKIVLQYIGALNPTFDKIEFIKYKSGLTFNKDQFVDWNHVMMAKVPTVDDKSYHEVQIPLKKTYALVLSIKDFEKRKKAFDCLSALDLPRVLNIKVKETSGLLPHGVLGSDIPALQKNKFELNHCKNISWPVWIESRTDLQTRIEGFLKSNNILNRIPFKKLSIQDMGKKIFSGSDWIGVIGFDSTNMQDPWSSDPYGYLNVFVEDTKFISAPILSMKKLVNEAISAEDLNLKADLWRKAHIELMSSFYVIPIGELIKTHYYPKKLSTFSWADVASSFPQIDQLRLE
jgi:ABC-type transport system substrate-binding protein